MSRKPAYYSLGSIIFVVGAGFVATPAPAADYYAGKSVDMIVGNYPGGGFDIYARAVARHLGRNIPGNPTIVVKNMPGAGSAKAGYQVSTIAPKDGLSIGAITPGAIIGPLLDDKPDTNFDPLKVTYLGTANAGARICATYTTSKIKRFDACVEQQDAAGGRIAWRRRARLRLSPQAHHQRPDRGGCGLQGHARSRARYGAG